VSDPSGFQLNQSSPSVLAQHSGHAAPRRAGRPAQSVWNQPAPRQSMALTVLGVVAIALLCVVGLLVLGYLSLALGATAVVICGLLALVPLLLVLQVIRWIDRLEPEPRGVLLFAFLWGAAASVAIALLFDLAFQLTLVATNSTALYTEFGSLAVQAPIIEESAKGFGILLIFLVARKHFDGPVDGLVYGATIAAGFAFTENIQYFGQSLVESGTSGLASVFFLRAILSPFAHVMFTSCTGVALGFGAQRFGVGGAFGMWLLGLVPAIFLHALWNGGSYIAGDFLAFYIALQVPLFLVAVVTAVLLRRHEMQVTRRRLTEYAEAGWFTPAEVEMLSSWEGRRRAHAWAKSQGGATADAMQRFTLDATRLAYARHRILRDRNHLGKQRDERQILEAVSADRFALLHPAVAGARTL
jgi:RsiW-degrading membrane proteinase PrsW (M82 family)